MGTGAALQTEAHAEAPPAKRRSGSKGRTRGSRSIFIRDDARVSLQAVLKMRMEGGMTQSAIARAVGLSEQRISAMLSPFANFLASYDAGYHHIGQGEALDSGLESALGLIVENLNDPERMRQTDVRSLALSLEKIHIASRLRKGESTSNSELHIHVQGAMSGALDGASKRGKVDFSPDRQLSSNRTDATIDVDAQAALPAPSSSPPAHSARFDGRGGISPTLEASAGKRSTQVAGAALLAYQRAVAGALKSPRRKPVRTATRARGKKAHAKRRLSP